MLTKAKEYYTIPHFDSEEYEIKYLVIEDNLMRIVGEDGLDDLNRRYQYTKDFHYFPLRQKKGNVIFANFV